MLKLKAAQMGSQPDFVDVNVRRLLGYMAEKQSEITSKLRTIESINEHMDNLKRDNPHISLQELQTQQPQLWAMFEEVMEGNWSLNPHQQY